MRVPLLCCLLLATALPRAAIGAGLPDPSFGPGGFRTFAFQPTAGESADHAYIGCTGPAGTFQVVGSASNNRRLVVVRLREDGTPDPSFGIDGKLSIALAATVRPGTAAGACLANGDIAVARPVTTASGDTDTQVFVVDGATGALDTGFAGTGVLALDLDARRADLANTESALGLDVLADGTLAVSGFAALAAGGAVGFVARVTTGGGVDRVGFIEAAPGALVYASGVADGPDATLWVAGGQAAGTRGIALTRLDRTTLGVIDQPHVVAVPAGTPFAVHRARMIEPGAYAVAAARGLIDSLQPELVVFRASGATRVVLPATRAIGGGATGVSFHGHDMHLAPLPGRRVLVTMNLQTGDTPVGFQASLVALGGAAGPDALDLSFGAMGASPFRHQPSDCAARAEQYASRLGLWAGRPMLTGSIVGGCSPFPTDYLVARLEEIALFSNGFD